MKKIFALALAVLMVVGVMSACTPSVDLGTGYTYKSYTTALGTNWNPHTWETNGDSDIMAYIETPLVDMSIKNSETGEFQWTFEAATSVEDVTAKYQDALTKYAVTLPEGKTAADITEGYVFEIKLNPNMKWENGTAINADTYIYSMKALLDPAMRNYRSNLYWSGESAVAGGYTYYNSGAPIYAAVVPAYDAEAGETGDYSFDITANKVFINPTSNEMTIAGYSMSEICSDYGYITAEAYEAATKGANAYGYVEITADNKEAVLTALDQYLSAFGLSIYNEDKSVNEELYKEFLFYFTGENSNDRGVVTNGKITAFADAYMNNGDVDRTGGDSLKNLGSDPRIAAEDEITVYISRLADSDTVIDSITQNTQLKNYELIQADYSFDEFYNWYDYFVETESYCNVYRFYK